MDGESKIVINAEGRLHLQLQAGLKALFSGSQHKAQLLNKAAQRARAVREDPEQVLLSPRAQHGALT
jgi:hypothetical protein